MWLPKLCQVTCSCCALQRWLTHRPATRQMPASRGQLEFLCDQAQGTGFFQGFLSPECKQVLASIGQLEFFYDQAPII